MNREQRARELQAWIERYVREEVEKRLEEDQYEQPGNMAEWLASGSTETTDADGFTKGDRAFLSDMKISTEVIQ
jgi:hypothetical protein